MLTNRLICRSWVVSPRITQPRQMMPRYRFLAAKAFAASGNSQAPGTQTTSIFSASTPASTNVAFDPSNKFCVISSLYRETTIANGVSELSLAGSIVLDKSRIILQKRNLAAARFTVIQALSTSETRHWILFFSIAKSTFPLRPGHSSHSTPFASDRRDRIPRGPSTFLHDAYRWS